MLSPTDSDYRSDEASTLNTAPDGMPVSVDERPATTFEQEVVAPELEPDDSPVTPGGLNVQEKPVTTSEAAADVDIGDPLTGADSDGSSAAPEAPIAESPPHPDGTDTKPGAVDGDQAEPGQGVTF